MLGCWDKNERMWPTDTGNGQSLGNCSDRARSAGQVAASTSEDPDHGRQSVLCSCTGGGPNAAGECDSPPSASKTEASAPAAAVVQVDCSRAVCFACRRLCRAAALLCSAMSTKAWRLSSLKSSNSCRISCQSDGSLSRTGVPDCLRSAKN
eukprot:1243510-Alexandrium_andersonii.AAC.1